MEPSELKSGVRELIFDNARGSLLLSFIYVLIMTIAYYLMFRLPGVSEAYVRYMALIQTGEIHSLVRFIGYISPIGIFFALLLLLFGSVIRAGYKCCCLNTSRNRGGSIGDLLSGFRLMKKVIVISLITSVLVILWSSLFFFPGLAAFYRYRLAYYILLDDPDKSAMQCIIESKFLTKGNKLDLFILDLSFIGWFVFSAAVILTTYYYISLPLTVVSLWLCPYIGITRSLFYDHLLTKATA